jgi:hypothetical protein
MPRWTAFLVLVLLVMLVPVAPAAARPMPTSTVGIEGEGFGTVTTTGSGKRAVAEGAGELTLGELPSADTGIVMTQRYSGWNGKDPVELLGKTVMGEITITAENGDELFGTYRGEVDHLYVPPGATLPVIFGYSELTFRRGTGQFRGLTGIVEIDVARCFGAEMMGFWILDDAVVTLPR